MKGFSPFTQKSALKQDYDASGTDKRVYDISNEKYNAWKDTQNNAPTIGDLGDKSNKKWLEAFLAWKGETKKKGTTETKTTDPEGRETGTETKKTTVTGGTELL